MDYKAGFLVITLLVGCFALPTPEDDLSIFFDHTDANARIVGGTQAQAANHLHMVAMTSGIAIRSFMCGGSVIARRTVLTAAHCIDAAFSFGSLSSSLRVTVGTTRWNSGGTTLSLRRNVTHPNYLSGIIKNDIGLLITSSDIPYGQLVQPIPVSYDNIGAGVGARVAGWGRIRAGGSLSATLLQLELDTLGGDDCRDRVAKAAIDLNMRNVPPVEPHIEICTFHGPGFGTCNGDSGSALVRRSDRHQIGVVSWGFPCARGAPDMFARVSAFRDFITSNTVN